MKFLLLMLLCGMLLDCAYAPPSQKHYDMTNVRNRWVKYYFNKGFSYKDITLFLATVHGFTLGVSGLKKALKKLGMRRRETATQESLNEVVRCVREEIDGSGNILRLFNVCSEICRKLLKGFESFYFYFS